MAPLNGDINESEKTWLKILDDIKSKFSGKFAKSNKEILINDVISTIGLWKELNKIDDLQESLKWIIEYVASGYKESKLKSLKKFSLNKCALIVKILLIGDEYPKPFFILYDKIKEIYVRVLSYSLDIKDDHNEIMLEKLFSEKFSDSKVKKQILKWNPIISSYITYLYGWIYLERIKIIALIKKTRPKDKYPDTNYPDSCNESDDINIDSYRSVLLQLLFIRKIQPHKVLLFLDSIYDYTIQRNRNAREYFLDNIDKRLEDVYNAVYQNNRHCEIKTLFKLFHKEKLEGDVKVIYKSSKIEDKMIIKLAGDEQYVKNGDKQYVKNLAVKIFFHDCYTDDGFDYRRAGHKLANWNNRIRTRIFRLLS